MPGGSGSKSNSLFSYISVFCELFFWKFHKKIDSYLLFGVIEVLFCIYLLHQGLAEKYKKTVAQVILRWGIQRNTVVIPKSSKLERLQENFNILDFELTKEDMDLIKSLDRNYRTNQPAKFWGIDLYA